MCNPNVAKTIISPGYALAHSVMGGNKTMDNIMQLAPGYGMLYEPKDPNSFTSQIGFMNAPVRQQLFGTDQRFKKQQQTPVPGMEASGNQFSTVR